MIIYCPKSGPYKKLLPNERPRNINAVCQVVILGDEARDLGGGRWQMVAYSLQALLDLRERAEMLAGHPMLDLQKAEGDAFGYLELTGEQAQRIVRWKGEGDLVGVRNYSRLPGRTDHQVQRVWLRRMLAAGLLTEADMWWLKNVCETSHHYTESEAAKLAEAQEQADGVVRSAKKRRRPKRDGGGRKKLARKMRREMERERTLYGGIEKIGGELSEKIQGERW